MAVGERAIYDVELRGRRVGTGTFEVLGHEPIDGRNAENVVWPTAVAPSGTYRVVVDYYDDCGEPRTDWIVTVQVAGTEPRIYSGSFTGIGATTPMLQVGTFTY